MECVLWGEGARRNGQKMRPNGFFLFRSFIFFLRVRYGAQYWEKGEVAIVPAPIPVDVCASAVWGVPVNAAGIAGGIASSDEPPH